MTTVYNKNGIEFDIDDIATDLNGKADVDLTNVNNTGYTKMAGAGMPSSTYINLTLGASGTAYTAPANGWVFVRFLGNVNINCGHAITMLDNNNNVIYELNHENPNGNGSRTASITPIQKNLKYIISYWNSTGEYFRFIYAKGSESEAN